MKWPWAAALSTKMVQPEDGHTDAPQNLSGSPRTVADDVGLPIGRVLHLLPEVHPVRRAELDAGVGLRGLGEEVVTAVRRVEAVLGAAGQAPVSAAASKVGRLAAVDFRRKEWTELSFRTKPENRITSQSRQGIRVCHSVVCDHCLVEWMVTSCQVSPLSVL